MKKETLKENWEEEFDKTFEQLCDCPMLGDCEPCDAKPEIESFIRNLLAQKDQEYLKKIEGKDENT